MKLSVCVVNYHADEQLKNFVASFGDYRPGCLHEMIIVNNGSEVDDLQKCLRDKFGDWIRVISSVKNIGYGVAQNRAVGMAKGEYVLLCNPDLEVLDDSVQKLLDFLESQNRWGIVGPQLIFEGGKVQESCRRFPRFVDLVANRLGFLPFLRRRKRYYLMRDKNLKETMKVDWLVGAMMLMKRDLFLELGGFDKRFFLFFEDADLCRRVKEAGYEVWYYPEAVLLHAKQRLSERGLWPFTKAFWIHLNSARKYFAKWGGGRM